MRLGGSEGGSQSGFALRRVAFPRKSKAYMVSKKTAAAWFPLSSLFRRRRRWDVDELGGVEKVEVAEEEGGSYL